MLIHFVAAVSRKMLDGNRHIFFIRSPLVLAGKLQNHFRMTAVGSDICNGIVIVIVNIHHRCKAPVASYSFPLPAGNFAQTVSLLRVCGCRNLHLFTKASSCRGDSVTT